MSLLTSNIFSRITFQIHETPGKRHTVTFFDGYAIQHHFERRIADTGIWTEVDMSDYSPFIGMTYNCFKRKAAHFELNQQLGLSDFSIREFRGVDLWLAGRWNFLKEYTASNHVSARCLRNIREALNHGE